jgi:hypothetical protein
VADLKLSINADYQQASKAFKELADSSEATREKIEKFSNSFKEEQIDKFIDKQKLLEVSLKGTRGETDAMTTAQKNYEKEIERLIKSGLDPESDAIKKLRDEHDKLADKIKETNEVQKKQEELMKGAEKMAIGLYAAIGAGVAATLAATQKTAEMGDQYAKTSRIIGMTAETFQELDYAAKMSGVDNLDSSLEKLNKSIADVKNETGTLTNYLKNNDEQLLTQLKNVNSNEEAFNLLMDAIGKAPDEFTRAELAQAAFGKSGQELILLANEGADGIANLREEARKYGVISNETAANSEAYLDSQARLKAALTGVTTELTSKLLPGLTDTITKIADFIAGVDNWEKILTVTGYALAGVTAGLTAFLIVTKGAALIHGVATAFRALTAAMADNPLSAIAVLITAVLIPALILLYKNWDTVQTYLQQGLARLQFAFKWLGSVIEEGLVVAFNAVKAAAITLVDFIYGNIIRAIGSMLEVLGKLPFVGDLFLAAADKVNSLGNAIGNLAEQTRQSSIDAIQAAHDKQDATQQELENTLATIDLEAQARRAAIEEQKNQNKEIIEDEAEKFEQISELKNEAVDELATQNDEIVQNELATQEEITQIKEEALEEQIKTLKEKLAEIPLNEKEIQTQQMEQFQSFLQERMKLQQVDDKDKLEWLKGQKELLMEVETLNGDERIALEKKIDKMILEEDERLKENQIKLIQERFSTISDFFGDVGSLLKEAGKENRNFLVAEKALSAAQALINSSLAFTKALASSAPPFNLIAAAGVLASGIAQQVKILSTPIPSAETGGRFIVPNSIGSDSQYMKVNQGEEVDVTPRGMTGFNKPQNIIVQIEKQTIFDVVNDGIVSGDILIAASNY